VSLFCLYYIGGSLISQIYNIMSKVYALVIGADRISTNDDVNEFKRAGLLNGTTSILDVQINMGPNKSAEVSASNIAFEGQYKKLAVGEFQRKQAFQNRQPKFRYRNL
jgi:hypothetical protein